MGFFKKLAKSLNPVNQTKQMISDPKQGLKNAGAMGLDPAGSVVRAGSGSGNMAPQNARQMIDPSGKVIATQPQAAPVAAYTPRQMNLSPAAQQLYNEMKARTAARNAARSAGQPVVGVGMGAAPAPQVAAPPTASSAWAPTGSGGVRPALQLGAAPTQPQAPVMGGQPAPRIQPVMSGAGRFADGGKVGSKKHGCDATFTSKVFDRKPNGKPC